MEVGSTSSTDFYSSSKLLLLTLSILSAGLSGGPPLFTKKLPPPSHHQIWTASGSLRSAEIKMAFKKGRGAPPLKARRAKAKKSLAKSQKRGGSVLRALGRKVAKLTRTIETKMMMIAFITIKSSLVPLIEGLCAQI